MNEVDDLKPLGSEGERTREGEEFRNANAWMGGQDRVEGQRWASAPGSAQWDRALWSLPDP